METLDRNPETLTYSKKRVLDPSIAVPCRSFTDRIDPTVELSSLRTTPI